MMMVTFLGNDQSLGSLRRQVVYQKSKSPKQTNIDFPVLFYFCRDPMLSGHPLDRDSNTEH